MSITSMVEQAILMMKEQGVDLSKYEITMSKDTVKRFAEENNFVVRFVESGKLMFWGLTVKVDDSIEQNKIYVMKGGKE